MENDSYSMTLILYSLPKQSQESLMGRVHVASHYDPAQVRLCFFGWSSMTVTRIYPTGKLSYPSYPQNRIHRQIKARSH